MATSVRDPLYGFVQVNDTEQAILDSPTFQRLRRIKQLSYAYLVYPGAVHTRLEHSLGTMHVAGQIAEHVGLENREQRHLRLALLLHDIGHGPFSHAFEDVLSRVTGAAVDHEDITLALLDHDDAIADALHDDRAPVESLLEGEGGGLAAQVVSGGLDADKLDYLRRDSYHTGVEYGTFDFHRVLECMSTAAGNLVVEEKGINALEGFKLARFSLHTQVYNHHARAIAEEMLGRAARLAVEDEHIDEDRFRFDPEDPGAFLDRYTFPGPFASDHAFERMLYENAEGRALELIRHIKARPLFKRAFQRHLTDLPPLAKGRVMSDDFDPRAMETDLADEIGVPEHRVFVVVQRIDTKQYEGALGRSEDAPILIQPSEGDELKEHDAFPVMSGPREPPHRFLVYGPEAEQGQLGEATEAYLGELG